MDGVDNDPEGARRLVAAWIEGVVARESWAPVIYYPDQAARVNEWLNHRQRKERQSESIYGITAEDLMSELIATVLPVVPIGNGLLRHPVAR